MRALFGPLSQRFDDITADFLRPMLHVPSHPIKLTRFGLYAATSATVLARRWSTAQGQSLFAGVAAHAFRPFSSPMSSAIGVTLSTAAHRYGWPVAEGGSGAISRAIISLREELGGKIETGVRVDSLADLASPDIVMLDVAPAAAVRIAGERVPRRIARALSRFRHGPGTFKVEFAIEGGVPWTYEQARRAGTVHVGGTLQEIAARRSRSRAGRSPTSRSF